MKNTVVRNVGSAIILTGLAFAITAHAHEQDGTGAMGMGMKPETVMPDNAEQMQMGKMQEAMLRMHEQMHKIQDAKNPQERERLMREHTKLMQDHMQMMKGMMGKGAMMGAGQHEPMDQMGNDMPAAPAKK
jgi:hypothetical protein